MATTKDDTPKVPAKSAGRRRLRNARIERDKPANADATAAHRARCRGMLDGLLIHWNEFLSEPLSLAQGGTRMHKDDAREVKALIEEFRMAAYELFRGARIQQHGVPDKSLDDPAGADLSNVVSIMDRKTREVDHV